MTQPVVTEVVVPETDSTDSAKSRIWQLAEQIDTAVRSAEACWQKEVEEGVFEALQRVAGELAAVNAAAKEALESAGSHDRAELRSALRAYRQAIAEDVVGKMGRLLRSNPPEEKATVALLTLLDALVAPIDDLPEHITDPSGTDPYRSDDADYWSRRLRKAVSRTARYLLRRRRIRQIPFKSLAAYHLQVRTARRYVRRHHACLRQLCAVLSEIEDAFAEWTHAVLDLEKQIDAPGYYSPEAFPVPPGEPDGEAPTPNELAREAYDVASNLTAGLQHVVVALDFRVPPDPHDDANDAFRDDLAVAGTFMLKEADRTLPSQPYLPASLVESDQQAWTTWMEHSRNRMRINWHLLNLRSVLVRQLEVLAERAALQTVQPLTKVLTRFQDRLKELRVRLNRTFDMADKSSAGEAIVGEMARLREEIDALVAELTASAGSTDAASDFLKDFGDSEGAAVAKTYDQLPGPLPIRTSAASRLAIEIGYAQSVEVDLKSIAQWMLNLRYSDQVRRHRDKLRLTVTRKWIDLEQAAEVVRFGLAAATDEFRPESENEAVASDFSRRSDHARELAVEGFSRAIEMVASDDEDLKADWGKFVLGVVGIALRDWATLHRQVVAAETSEEWIGYRDRVRRGIEAFTVTARRLARDWRQKSETVLRLGRSRAHSLIRRGQSAVGVSQATRGRKQETIDAISGWREILEGLPLVYRRLFSFDPLQNASHVVNRTNDLSIVRNHFERWQKGLSTNTLMLSGPAGSGRSTFMNLIEGSIFGDADVRRITFKDRYESEAPVARDIADALGVKMDDGLTLDRLESILLARDRGRIPTVCIIENLEHVLLRTPGGSNLLELLLIFFSRTDQVVYWISGVGNLARHFLEQTLRIGGFIDFHALESFDQEAIQSMLLTRHRKSGLPLQFEPPDDAGPIMRQRLRRAKSTLDRQNILMNAFFERLHRDSGQSLRMALFYWLRSIDFSAESDQMTVRSVRTLNTDFLNEMDLKSAFSLKAILFHLTLTLDEHNRIFRTSNQEGTVIMESLLNSGLIVPVGKSVVETQARIESGVRYRVQPLLVHPVTEQLRGRHIIY